MKTEIPKNPPLVNFPSEFEVTIFLIKSELKYVKFTNDLNNKGIDTYGGFLDFSLLISSIMGFANYNRTDHFKEWYFDRQTNLVKNMNPENDEELLEIALSFYADLLVRKREMDMAEKD